MTTASVADAMMHARTQAGIDALLTIPASAATDRPSDVEPGAMLWAETLAPGGYTSLRLPRDARLKLIDTAGDGCVAMLLFNAERPFERLNVADTLKVQWNTYLGTGSLLLSDMGRVLATIVADDCTGHDALCGPSSAIANRRRYGNGENWSAFPNARDRFKLGAAKLGLSSRDIHPCITWFKPVIVGRDGATSLKAGPFAAGQSVTLRLEQPVAVVLANCPHVLDARPSYPVTPVRVLAWRGVPGGKDDRFRNATPERRRAFENLDADPA